MNANTLRKGWLVASVFLLAACGSRGALPNDPVVTIEVPPAPESVGALAFAPPGTIAGFQCLFVNVMGEGIGNWAGAQGVVSSSTRGYMGVFSGMIEPVNGGKLSVTVPAGKARIIQVIGAKHDGFVCPTDLTATKLYSTATFPEMYQIARTTVDVVSDMSIELNSTYSSGSAVEVRYQP